jgi:hypothetical protein
VGESLPQRVTRMENAALHALNPIHRLTGLLPLVGCR